MRWEEKYRPQQFREVHGQDHAVRLLSGLVLRRTGGRHLLFYGAVGSGKTSLVRVFAQGLNCQHVNDSGSPCLSCASCLESGRYFFEYDVAGVSGDKDDVRRWVDALNRSPTEDRVRVLFLDEAQALTHPAQESILKAIEGAAAGVIFCLATTEVTKLKPALRSRFMDIHVHALPPTEAVSLLESVAVKEGVLYDRQALYLIAAVKPPYARDLIIALEQLAGSGERIDTDLVKRVFDIDVRDHLGRYFIALADGDRTAQTSAMFEWRDDIAEKVRWIEKFLTATYYNDVLGQRLVIDSLVYSQDDERVQVVKRFCKRFDVAAPRDLAPHFEVMLEFWSQPKPDEEEGLYLKLALFEALVNSGLPKSAHRRSSPEAKIGPAAIESFRKTGDIDGESLWEEHGSTRSCFIEHDDVRQIINRASFFIQHYGACLNAAFTVELGPDTSESEESAIHTIKEISKDLGLVCFKGTSLFSSITLVERNGGAFVGRIVGHIKPDAELAQLVMNLVNKWSETDGHFVDVAFSSERDALRFHWDKVLELCAGFEGDNGETPVGCALRELLKIPKSKHRSPGPLDGRRLMYSPLLSTPSINRACANGMMPISAFDAEAWTWIANGWEEKEFPNRKEEIERRQNVLAELEGRLRTDQDRLQQELAECHAWWNSQNPEQRPRSWNGWRR